MTRRVVLVGIGNPLRGDDAAGCLVARRLEGTPGVTVVVSDETPERDVPRIVDLRPDLVILADAVAMGRPPGTVEAVEPCALAGYLPSTHRLPLALLADILRRASSAEVVVLAIQPARVELGAGVGPEVAAAVEHAADWVRRATRETAVEGARC